MNIKEMIEGKTLRVHGNGFIQCDVSPSNRLHFWGNSKIPRQATSTPIHDHVFDFDSTIIKGQLTNIMMRPVEGIDNVVYEVDHDGNLVDSGTYSNLLVTSTRTYNVGDKYHMAAGQVHDVYITMPTITSIFKYVPFMGSSATTISSGARIFAPWGVYPDNDFKRDAFDQDFLYRIVHEILEST